MKLPALPQRPPELADLETRHAKIHGEREIVETELRQLQDDAWQRSDPDVDVLDLAAERLANGMDNTGGRAVLPEQVEVMQSRLDLLQRAEFKLRQKISELRDTHNGRVARAFRPAHRQAAERIHKALIELVAANEAEEQLRSEVLGGKLSPASFPNVGGFGPHGGAAEHWRAWARRQGLIDEGDDFPMAAE